MAEEQVLNNTQLIDATQNALINVADEVAQVVENVGTEMNGHGGLFYENPEFWVGLAFVLVVLALSRPIGRALNGLLLKRADMIANRITEAQTLNFDAQKMLADYEKKYQNVEKEAKAILHRSEKEFEMIKEERLKRLEQELNAKQQEVEQRIDVAKEKVMSEISSLTADVTIRALKDVLEKGLSTKIQNQLVDQSIDQISRLKQ